LPAEDLDANVAAGAALTLQQAKCEALLT
jgi:hypothetical protein